jgi:large subunit ribosomal protein L18
MARATTSRELRERRHLRVRKKVVGTAERPRLSVFRSLQHVYAQVIDDTKGTTLVAASTLEPDLRGQLDGKTKSAEAEVVGQLIAQRAREHGIERVVFDRGGYQYHGRVKALAEAARAAGLSF